MGLAVVPLVYWRIATSSSSGLGRDAAMRRWSTSVSHVTVSFTGAVIAARARRAAGTGRRSFRRVASGMAAGRSTETIVSTGTSRGMSWMVPTTVFQAMTTRAPWSSNWWRSSRGVYSGLCSTTIAPSRSTA